jgi:mRNA interferase MazF
MVMVTEQFDVFLVSLEPAIGHEINKTRPCVIISPDDLNSFVRTVIIAPMTTKSRDYPTRVSVEFLDKTGQIVLDQIRTIDKSRLIKKLGRISESETKAVLNILQKLFAE